MVAEVMSTISREFASSHSSADCEPVFDFLEYSCWSGPESSGRGNQPSMWLPLLPADGCSGGHCRLTLVEVSPGSKDQQGRAAKAGIGCSLFFLYLPVDFLPYI